MWEGERQTLGGPFEAPVVRVSGAYQDQVEKRTGQQQHERKGTLREMWARPSPEQVENRDSDSL